MLRVALRSARLPKAATREKLWHHTNTINIADLVAQICRGRHRKILSTFCSRKTLLRISNERPRDHALHTVWWNTKRARIQTIFVQLVTRNDLFMTRDLKHAIRARVNDWISRFHVLVAELGDDRRPACRFVAESLGADLCFECIHQIFWKSVWISGKGLVGNDPHHFPVSG